MILVLPILLPFLAAALALLAWRWVAVQRWLGVAGAVAQLGAGCVLLVTVLNDGIQVVEIGNWPAPFGITLVADLLSASLVVTTGGLGVAVAMASFAGIDIRRESFGYYPLLLVLLVGIGGAFLTGDIFNLFVWFEVMLIASFVLLALGGERSQLEGAIKYVTINLIGSSMFLSAAGILYGMTGTLNMADLSVRLDALDSPILETTVAMLLLVVFGIKAAIFPLFSWLPASYHTPPSVVSAIFAGLLTKVGVYALFRTFTLLLPAEDLGMQPLLIGIAALTMLAGAIGAVTQNDLRRLLSFLVVSGVGFMLMGLSLFTAVAIGAGVFYLLQDAVAKTGIFLVAGLMRRIGGSFDLGELGGLSRASPLVIPLFAIPALSLAGIPPMSGFVAKIGLVGAGLDVGQSLLVAAALVASFLTLLAVARAWAEAFWKTPPEGLSVSIESRVTHAGERLAFVVPTAVLVAALVAIGLAAEPIVAFSLQVGDQLADPSLYVDAVLGPGR
jgi:multicomponent Na+:H+ antiporter subunit D